MLVNCVGGAWGSTQRVAQAARIQSHASQQHGAAQPPQRQAAWRRQQQWRRRRGPAVCSASDEDGLDQQLQADLERLRQREQQQQQQQGGAAAPKPLTGPTGPFAARQLEQQQLGKSTFTSSSNGGAMRSVMDIFDKVLIADFFFILFALGWLGAGLAERSALQSTYLLDTWLPLWQWVFQPAIGVLMLGALVSGGVGWARENLGSQQRR